MLTVIVPDIQRTYGKHREENPVPEFHITPPFTSPSGPVHFIEAKPHERRAIIPITVKVIANANTSG